MRIYANFCLFAFNVIVLPLRAVTASPLDGFLDQPIPPGFVPHIFKEELRSDPKIRYGPGWIGYESYQERLDALKKLSPRKLILPEGFAEFIRKVEERSNWNRGDTLFPNERNGVSGYGTSYRAFMTESFHAMALDFKYDPRGDAVVVDFPWHLDDPRSSADLLHILETTKPFPGESPSFLHSADPWRNALDAVLSKPANFSSAWKLRYLDDVRDMAFFTRTSRE